MQISSLQALATSGIATVQSGTQRGNPLSSRENNISRMPRLSVDFQQVVEALRNLQNRNDPALTNKASGYQDFDGELFAETGPQLADIDQSQLGDCYFLAALGSMVAEDPDAVRNMIRDNGDNTYTVTFYAEIDGNRARVEVTVDDDLPVDANGNLIYAQSADSDGDGQLELWVPIVEKAYAKFQDQYGPDDGVDGYNDMVGGWSSEVLEDLTGKPARRIQDISTDAELLGLLSAVHEGEYVCVDTLVRGTDPGWVAQHAYTVVDVYDEAGETMVVLRNPWGRGEPEGSDPSGNADDGLFAVPLDELRENIRSVETTEPALPVDRLVELLLNALHPSITA